MKTVEACIGVLGMQDICHFTSRDIGYCPSNFQGYGILCSIFSLLSGISKIEETELWGYLPVYKGYLPVYFQGYGILGTPLYKPHCCKQKYTLMPVKGVTCIYLPLLL